MVRLRVEAPQYSVGSFGVLGNKGLVLFVTSRSTPSTRIEEGVEAMDGRLSDYAPAVVIAPVFELIRDRLALLHQLVQPTFGPIDNHHELFPLRICPGLDDVLVAFRRWLCVSSGRRRWMTRITVLPIMASSVTVQVSQPIHPHFGPPWCRGIVNSLRRCEGPQNHQKGLDVRDVLVPCQQRFKPRLFFLYSGSGHEPFRPSVPFLFSVES
jgi:hypothetical protein